MNKKIIVTLESLKEIIKEFEQTQNTENPQTATEIKYNDGLTLRIIKN